MNQRISAANGSLLVLVLMLVGWAGCTEDTVSPPDVVIPGPGDSIIYSKHVQPIFSNSCAGSQCHVGGRPAGLSLESWELIVEGSEFGNVVIPFSPTRSHLFQHINGDSTLGPTATPRMPLSRDPLPDNQIATIQRWIAEGARNDLGDIPLAGNSRRRAFVTCQSEDVVAAIDLATGHIARYITVGSLPDDTSPPEAPHNILFSPDERFFFVNLVAVGVVEKYDARTFEKVAEANVGLSPAQIVITADGSTIYVSNFDVTFQQQYINRLDASDLGQVQNIEVEGKAPHGVILSRDEKFIYTMNAGSDDVSKIDLATDEVVARIPMVPGSPAAPAGAAEHEPYQAVITDQDIMFVTCRKSGEVRVIDLNAEAVIDSIEVGDRPLIPALSPNGNEVWIPNQASASVSIVDVSTRSVSSTISGINSQPHGIAFDAVNGNAFVSCENLTGGENLHHPISGTEVVPGIVYKIGIASKQIEQTIEVGGFAAGLVSQ